MSLAEALPAAVGIAANPPAIIAVLLLLSSSTSKRTAAAFVGGWVVGLAVVGALVIAIGDAAQALGDPSVAMLAVRLAIGVMLVVLAVWYWLRRGQASDEPGWIRSLTGMSRVKAFGSAALFSALNPKTLAFNVAGCLVIADAELTVTGEIVALVAFVLLSSVTVLLPLLYSVLARQRGEATLAKVRDWLVRNSAAITAIVLLVLGVLVVFGSVEKLWGTA